MLNFIWTWVAVILFISGLSGMYGCNKDMGNGGEWFANIMGILICIGLIAGGITIFIETWS